MKAYLTLIVVAIMVIAGSCKKNHLPLCPRPVERKIRFELYTNADLSTHDRNIQFSVRINNTRRTIFDSLLTPMKVKDIPDFDHRIIIEKTVPGNDTSRLTVGFVYTIENVGYSWYLESFPAADTFKLLRYPYLDIL